MVTPAASATQRISRRGGSLFMNGKEMRPYLQGALDGLCAVYSIVNAARIISDTGRTNPRNCSNTSWPTWKTGKTSAEC